VGVIDEQKFAYDLWGDAVNTASRTESHGEAGRIHVSEEFRDVVLRSTNSSPLEGLLSRVAKWKSKVKGLMRTYFLEKV